MSAPRDIAPQREDGTIPHERAALELRLLGPLTITRAGLPLALPASRKVRALLAYLAAAPGAVSRSALCDLLWDGPNDPRGELRWCLSKLRRLLDDGEQSRVATANDTVRLALDDAVVDVSTINSATAHGLDALDSATLTTLEKRFRGEFLEGLEIERCALFNAWLLAQRRRLRACHTALLELLVNRVEPQQAQPYLDRWLALAPFDSQAHERQLRLLAAQGRLGEGEEHLAATLRLFDAEGLDSRALRASWRAARSLPARATAATHTLTTSHDDGVGARRASIAVMPFVDSSPLQLARGGTADALAHDVITRLAKLRTLFVIAQGTVFALHERGLGAEEAGRLLNVDFLVSGAVRMEGARLTVTVELSETRKARILWAEIFHRELHDSLHVLDEIGNQVVAAVASEIESFERNRAILKPPASLDAWEAHHRGLWHMYQYHKADNVQARHYFETALRLDPTFSRAYAGLSFTHFQGVFQNWEARAAGTEQAYRAAVQGVMADERDPAVHWALGRALWLRGRHQESLAGLTRCIELSPNFALGHYNLAFFHVIAGSAEAAISCSDYSRALSPFDPMLCAMLATRAMALVRLARFDEAAGWAVQSVMRPNAFPHIQILAACCQALAGHLDDARNHAAAARLTAPDYSLADFFEAFPFDDDARSVFRRGAKRVGIR